jgi:hypothetical protein
MKTRVIRNQGRFYVQMVDESINENYWVNVNPQLYYDALKGENFASMEQAIKFAKEVSDGTLQPLPEIAWESGLDL